MKPTSPSYLAYAASRAFSLIACAALALSACQSQPPLPAPTQPPSADAAAQAETTGEPLVAAREYARLALTVAPPQRQEYQLKSIELLLKAGQIAEARAQLANIVTVGLDPAFIVRKQILQARIAIAEGKSDQALRLLNQAEKTRSLDPSLSAEIYRVRAQAEALLGNIGAAALILINRERFIVDDAALRDNQQQLWSLLTTQSRPLLQKERALAKDARLAGWIDLALVVADHAPNSLQLGVALGDWEKTHAQHPALKNIFPLLVGNTPGLIGRIHRIALLLPLSSDYGAAAQAVRDGFLAVDSANQNTDKPTVKVYDIGADASQAPAIYAAAIQEGAQFIVGPLGVEAAEQVAKSGNMTVPTLLLSHVEAIVNAHAEVPVFQFGLPPEQEAAQAAERAFLDGRRRAAVLYADNSSGQRMLAAFSSHWQRLGGTVVSAQKYTTGMSDYSDPVRQMLRIDASEARLKAVEARMRARLKFEPRPREDIDAIFLAADSKHARLIKPQLSYFRASQVPVYATSHVFGGKPDPTTDVDLDGIMFGDMPWMLASGGKIDELRAALPSNAPYAHTPLDRVFALGVDAYAVIPQLNRLLADPTLRFGGVSAGLSVDPNKRLHRQLLWARFRRGVPQLIDTFIGPNAYTQIPHGSATQAPANRP